MANLIQRLDGFIPQVQFETIAQSYEQRAQELGPYHEDYVKYINYAAKLRGDQAITRSRLLLGQSRVSQKGQGNADRYVYDAQGNEDIPTKPVRTEGQPPVAHDMDLVNITYDLDGDVRKYYKDVHNWNSITGKGEDSHSVSNYGRAYDNAFFDGKEMVYGRGDGTTFRDGGFNERTVSGHEKTHGVTAVRTGLIYQGEPGINNENISDVFGQNVKHYILNLMPDKAENWLLAPGIFAPGVNGRAIRDMLNPGTAFDDWRLGGKDPQPKSYKDYRPTDSDNGGVHLYSGIGNCAYATAAREIGLPVWEFIAHVWFDACGMIGSHATIAELAKATLQACKNRDAKHYNAVLHGWNTVDVNTGGSFDQRYFIM